MAAPSITLPEQSMCWPSDLATLTVQGDPFSEVRVRLQVVGAWSYECTLYTDELCKASLTRVDRMLLDAMHEGTLQADYTTLDVFVGAGGEGTELTLQGRRRVLLFDGRTSMPAAEWAKRSFLLLGNERTVPAAAALAPCELHYSVGAAQYSEACTPYTIYYLVNSKTGESRRAEAVDGAVIDIDDDQGSHVFNPDRDIAIQEAGVQAEAADWEIATVQHRLGLRVFTQHVQHAGAGTLAPLRVEFLNAFGYLDTLYLFGERVVEHKYEYTTATVAGVVRTVQVRDVPTIKVATGGMQWRTAAAVLDLCRAHKVWLVGKDGVRTAIYVSAAEHKEQAAPGEPLTATLSIQYCEPYPVMDANEGLTYDTTPDVFDNTFA